VSVFPLGYVCKKVLSLLYSTPLSEEKKLLPTATFIFSRLSQLPNASIPILVTLSGVMPQKKI